MSSPRSLLHVFAAAVTLALAACQPAPVPAQLSAKSLDSSAQAVGDRDDRVARKARDAGDITAAK